MGLGAALLEWPLPPKPPPLVLSFLILDRCISAYEFKLPTVWGGLGAWESTPWLDLCMLLAKYFSAYEPVSFDPEAGEVDESGPARC